MSKKKIFGTLSIAIIIVCLGYAYFKYNRYLPTLDQPHTPALAQLDIQKIRAQTPINLVKVFKAKRTLEILHHDQVIKTYSMRLGFDPIGHKVKEGDGKTPEGRYVIDWRNPQSQFYKSLHISYPNAKDKATAQALGVSAGGDVMIHGSANNKQLKALPELMDYMPRNDWTWGCVAVRNVDMDELWKLVDNGTAIEIVP